ncbi:AI-2E family transporter [Sphingomicrobium astaxanthinifaciens]|uniref:AI-2E family transporter n=1 Tax=Sphingomicrobium astaxanthinifaciens TaxID=1227949 RepID=UPI001FCC2200|nr:AI-2E family transporter [Sphingomicrobium astaxanthinifaciens]MCJ7421009.1 AI-2E family transporter [Sphingomicrobium astaxanthinifaciens]
MNPGPEEQSVGPTEIEDPRLRFEVRKALVWIGLTLLAAGVILLAAPLLLIAGGLVFAVLLDGGTRLLGRVLPIARAWRLLIVVLLFFGFIGWTGWYAGTSFVEQFAALRDTVVAQFERLLGWASRTGMIDDLTLDSVGGQILSSVGRVTSILGTALGALTGVVLMIVIGIFIAAEPRLYDRGLAWMLPRATRPKFYEISDHVAYALRRLLAGRLLGMLIEGVFTYVMLTLGARLIGLEPFALAPLLALLTGLLAFIPNVGAFVSGVLLVAVGFSQSNEAGFYAIFVYLFVQNFDGYVVIPMIAKKTVDLAPALVLAMQIVMGTLFGILGLLLADPLLAAIKAALEQYSKVTPGKTDVPPKREERPAS